MRTRTLIILLTCCALAVGIVEAQNTGARGQSQGPGQPRRGGSPADPHDGHNDLRPPFKFWAVDKIKQELKLTGQQAADIEKVFQASMEQLRVDKDAMDRAQTEFSKLMELPSAPERDFTRAVDKLEMARYNTSKERTTMLVRIHTILTPDQRKGLEAIRKRNDRNNDADKNRPH
jgi:Spy/CpxP family protein refolding chaperone